MYKRLGLSLLMTALMGCSASADEQSRISRVLSSITQFQEPEEELVIEEVNEVEEVLVPEQRWIGSNFTENELVTLNFLQDQGIKDRMALSVILGNIKQESKFHPNICEGGARVPYDRCYRGGFGLVQWTTSFRYWGLGNHAKTINGDPSTLPTQLSYLVTEREWKKALWRFKTPDKSLDFYMKGAYVWLGWGIYGNRGYFSQNYYDRLSLG